MTIIIIVIPQILFVGEMQCLLMVVKCHGMFCTISIAELRQNEDTEACCENSVVNKMGQNLTRQ
jgi:hypothetical protein